MGDKIRADLASLTEIHAVEVNSLNEVINEKENLITSLRRKHPHDEHLEALIAEALSRLNETEIDLVKWLLGAETVTAGTIQGKYRGVVHPDKINQNCGLEIIKAEILHSFNGTAIGCNYSIHSTLRLGLRNFLYAPKS